MIALEVLGVMAAIFGGLLVLDAFLVVLARLCTRGTR